MTTRIRLGISTCPNDTFAFAAILDGHVGIPGIDLQIELLDVQELNEGLVSGRFDVAKASYAAALQSTQPLTVLNVGSALGYDVGPVLLARDADVKLTASPAPRVLCPGELTTATLLFQSFHGDVPITQQVVFSDIIPALVQGTADLGVCIHEGRFTYQQQELHLVEDLGETWERRMGGPLPLGGIFSRDHVPEHDLRTLAKALRASIRHGREHPESALPVMKRHAQELGEEEIWKHVELYVNDQTYRLDENGVQAIHALRSLCEAQTDVRRPAGQLTILQS